MDDVIDVQVADIPVSLGLPAVIPCRVASAQQPYVRVSAWMSDDGLLVLPPLLHPHDLKGKFTHEKNNKILK